MVMWYHVNSYDIIELIRHEKKREKEKKTELELNLDSNSIDTFVL